MLKLLHLNRAHYLITRVSVIKKNMFDHDRYVGPGSSPTFQFKTRKRRQIVKGQQICEANKRKRYVDTERNSKI